VANEEGKKLPPPASQWRRPPIADEAQFKQLQAKANQLAKTTPDDTKLANSQQLLQALPRSCIIPYTTQDEVQARKTIQEKAQARQQGQAQKTSYTEPGSASETAAPAPSKKKKHHPAATPAS